MILSNVIMSNCLPEIYKNDHDGKGGGSVH